MQYSFKKFYLMAILIIILLGCEETAQPDAVNIRLSNVSTYDFESVEVNTSTGMVSFGDLKANAYTSYKVFDLAYRYAYVELLIEGESYVWQPIDYVGETPLSEGQYTYQLGVDSESGDNYGRLTLELVEE